MFDLSDSVLDDIIFAMEDQGGEWLVDIERGEIVNASDEELDEEGPEALEADGSPLARELVPVPEWSSREGFELMESFVASLRGPGARAELQAALSRGRGVFRAFKETLGARPELERAFHDHKRGLMGRRIRAWYDDLRELRGLSRLGPEPEDTEDLAASDFAILVGGPAEAEAHILRFLERLEAEALEALPADLAAWEAERVREELAREDWLGAWIEDGEGGALAAAAARREDGAGKGFCRVFFVHVAKDFRRAGLGRSLIERLGRELGAAEEGGLLLLDSGFMPRDFEARLGSSGYTAWGGRAYRRT